jgi:hypothetical protein
MAPNGFEKARLLLLSQCGRANPGDFIPRRNADWDVIGSAIRILKTEKNGKRACADRLLEELKNTGRYLFLSHEVESSAGRSDE